MDKILQKQILRGIWVALIIGFILLLLYYVIPLVYPFIYAWLLAYLLNPMVSFLKTKAKLPRWLAVITSLLLFIGLTVTTLSLLVTNIVLEISAFAEIMQQYINDWKDHLIRYINSASIQDIISQVNAFYAENPQYQNTINNNLSSTAKTLADFGSAFVGGILNFFVNLLASLPNIASLTIIALLAAFFISKDWLRLIPKISSFFPETTKVATRSIWSDLQKALFGYIRAQIILISLTAIVVIIGLMILHVKYAITIGLLVGFADLLPYLGTGAIMVPWILVEFIQHNLYLGVGLSILYSVILIARQIMEPKVLATSVGLNPLAMLFAMYVGLKLFGVLGLIIGPISLIMLSAFHRANVFRDIQRYIVKGSIRIIE